MKITAKTKGRSWTFVVYQEDIEFNDMKLLLDSLKIPCAISPLHSPDSEDSKSHWHVLMVFAGNKTPDSLYQDLGVLRKKGNYLMFQKVSSISAMCRYLVHKDNPEKEQFTGDVKKLVTCLNGFNFQKYYVSETEEVAQISEILNYIFEVKPTFNDLVYHINRNRYDLLQTLSKKSFMFFSLCKKNQERKEDIQSGKELGKMLGGEL